MKLTLELPWGRLELENDDQKDLLREAAFFAELPRECPVCGSGVTPFYRNPQGYHYYGLRCLGTTAHESTFGQHREGGSLFYKAGEAWKTFGQWQDEQPPQDDYQAPPDRSAGQQRQDTPRQDDWHTQAQAQAPPPSRPQAPVQQQPGAGQGQALICARKGCGAPLTQGQYTVSMKAYGIGMCPRCQVEHNREQTMAQRPAV